MVDRVKPLKMESPSSGGTELDEFPTSLDKNEDYVDVRGVAIQDDSSDDENVTVSRDALGNMTFKDGVVSGEKTLNDLLGSSTDEKVKVSANDGTARYLGEKIVAGCGIDLTEQNDAGDEDLEVKVNLDLQHEEVLTEATTTATTYQDRLTLVTPALTGTYRIAWKAALQAQGVARLYNETDDISYDEHETALAQTQFWAMVGGFNYVEFTGAAKTFKIQWKKDSGSEVGIRDAKIEFWRAC